MGQDIHLFVEMQGSDGVWRHVHGPVLSSDNFQSWPQHTDLDGGLLPAFFSGSWWDHRHYGVNTILCPAGGRHAVRDETFSAAAQIPERGLPADITAEVQAEVDKYDTDAHSRTHMTVAEAQGLHYPGEPEYWAGWLMTLAAIRHYCGPRARLIVFLDN